MTEKEARLEPDRFRLPDEREGVTWKLMIGDVEGVRLGKGTRPPEGRGYYVKAYLTTGEYKDGGLGEVFITPDKEGSFIRGVLDGYALLLSIALQHGIPLEDIATKFLHMRFEPSGFTNDKAVPMASSFFDLMFRKLALKYLDLEAIERLGIKDRTSCAEEESEDGQWKEGDVAWKGQRPTTGLSGEPFNQARGFEEEFESEFDEADGS